MSSTHTTIDTTTALASLIPTLNNLPSSPPSLYLDLEGKDLGRTGTISIIQLYVLPHQHTYLIDVYVLGAAAFNTRSTITCQLDTFKKILESPSIPKCLFDVRGDADALYNLYGVNLKGVQDLQLMEFATRVGRKSYVNGLARCVEFDAGLGRTEKAEFTRKKESGNRLFRTGNYTVFEERPMRKEILEYCVQDVVHLPALWRKYNSLLRSGDLKLKVAAATTERVEMALNLSPGPEGRDRAIGPPSLAENSRVYQSLEDILDAMDDWRLDSFDDDCNDYDDYGGYIDNDYYDDYRDYEGVYDSD
jgi:exonuclease 3'-5' domain-containing protein 1